MITKYKYSIFRHMGGNIWLMIKDIHVCFDESSDWDCQIGRYVSILENKPSMGCVWNTDIFVMAISTHLTNVLKASLGSIVCCIICMLQNMTKHTQSNR